LAPAFATNRPIISGFVAENGGEVIRVNFNLLENVLLVKNVSSNKYKNCG